MIALDIISLFLDDDVCEYLDFLDIHVVIFFLKLVYQILAVMLLVLKS